MGNFPLCKTSEICIYYSQEKKLNIENNENNEFYDIENEKPTDAYGNNISISKESKYFLHSNASKIQKVFREYISKQKKKKKKEKLITNQEKKKEINNDFSMHSLIKSQLTTKKKVNKKNGSILVKDAISKRRSSFQIEPIKQKNKTLISFFSVSSSDDELIINNNMKLFEVKEEIYGNFLKKPNKSLKYHGEKDKINHKKNGYGIVTWDDKSQLFGIFTDNKVSGFCKFINKQNNTTFKGEYKNNIPKGYGYYETTHYLREGIWEKSKLNGLGYEIWDDKTFYKGEYLNNKKHGIGFYQWADKTYYEGEFNNNQITGFGLIYYTNDSFYSGEVLNGNMNGFGIFSWKNNHKYVGYFKNDLKCGFGIFIWNLKPLEAFVGFWNKGKQNGVGAKIHNGVFTYGIWDNGKKESWLKGEWEVKKCLTPEEAKFEKFLYKNELNAFIKSLSL